MLNFTDDIRGTIIGGDDFTGQIFYDGRPQKGRFYGVNKDELVAKAGYTIRQIKKECGEAFELIYPNQSWELRIFP